MSTAQNVPAIDRDAVIYLTTCQFTWGGVFDAVAADRDIHLVRSTLMGTPGRTLCGVDRFAQDGPGFNMGGGVSKHGEVHSFCRTCAESAKADFPGLPVHGLANCDYASAGLVRGDSWEIRRAIYAGAGAR